MKNTLKGVLILVSFLLGATKNSEAANYYWVGGTGSWSDYANHWATTSGGTTFQSSIPNINDDVFFDAQSFTAVNQFVQLDSTFYYCRNMSWAGVQFNPSIEGSGATLQIYGSIELNTNMTVNQTSVSFYSSLSGNTIDTKNKELGLVQILGSGTFTLLSQFNCSGSLLVQSGTFDANGNDINSNDFYLDANALFISGDIRYTLSGIYYTFNPRPFTALGVIQNSDQTTLYFNCSNGKVDATGQNTRFDSLIFEGSCTLLQVQANFVTSNDISFVDYATVTHAVFQKEVWINTCTFDTLEGKNIKLYQNTTTTVNNTINMLSDCNNLANLSSMYSTVTSTLNVPSGIISLDYLRLGGIIATGGATFIANNAIDNGGNTGWTISALSERKLYWIGGTGNWTDPNHWSLTSGGSPITCGPTKLDSVFFDSNSAANGDTIFIGSDEVEVQYMNISNEVGVTFYGSNANIYGSVDISSAINWRVNILSLRSNFSVATFSSVVPLMWLEQATDSAYILLNDLTTDQFVVQRGSMDMSNRNIYTITVNSYPNATINTSNTHFYTQLFNLSGTSQFSNLASITFNRTLSYMYSGGNFSSIEFLFDGELDSLVTAHSFTNIGAVTIYGDNTFNVMDIRNNLTLLGNTSTDTITLNIPGYALTQAPGKTLSIGNEIFSASDCNHLVSLRSTQVGSQTNIRKISGATVNLDYIEITDINAQGATFNATNCVDNGNNTGWIIQAPIPRTIYWVGGSGMWSDPSHWALSSGGTGGVCAPTAFDDVILDVNSGLLNQTLSIDLENAALQSLDCRTTNDNVTISGSSLSVYGNLYLRTGMNFEVDVLSMRSTSTAEILSAGNSLRRINIVSNGNYSLLDEISLTYIYISQGTFNMNGKNISVAKIESEVGTTFIGSANILEAQSIVLNGTSTNTDLMNVHLKNFQLNYAGQFTANGKFNAITVNNHTTFYNSGFPSNFVCKYLYAYESVIFPLGQNDSIQKAVFFNDAIIYGPTYFDTLFINSPGHSFTIEHNVYVSSQLICSGTPGFPVRLVGSTNNAGTLIKSGGDICLNNVLLETLPVIGTDNYYAGQGCVDLGGNTNWQFTNCSVVTDVWPGDANYDLLCNNLDVLNIGVAFNQTGPVRAGGNNSWTAQPAADFSSWFSSAINLKHADCDGNGIVDYADTVAISQNYSLTHPARYANPNYTISSILPPLSLDATPDTVGPSMPVNVDVLLGTSATPVDSLYGIAFTIHYDPTIVDTNSLQFNFAGSWLGTAGSDMLTFVRHFPTIGSIDVAMVRNDHNNVLAGFGNLASFDVVIVDNISTVTNSLFTLTDVSAITYSQYVQSVARVNDTIFVDPLFDKVSHANLNDYFSVYPNPTSTNLNIHSIDIKTEFVEIYDADGKLVLKDRANSSQLSINVGEIPQGVYQLRIITDKGVYNKPIEIIQR